MEEGMDFSEALQLVKCGSSIQRAGWNGKGMFVYLYKPEGDGTYLPFLMMKTADDKFVPWLASQTDILAEDWSVI